MTSTGDRQPALPFSPRRPSTAGAHDIAIAPTIAATRALGTRAPGTPAPGGLPDAGALLRLAVAAWVVLVLYRSARNAWARRDLLVLVWSRLRPGVWLRALGLFVVVVGLATALLELVPPLRLGLGTLVAFEGNAVFTPLDQAAGALGPPPAHGPDWALIALATGFLGLLLVLLPWLAFVEEEVFRAGTEELDGLRRAWSSLRFGLAHLVMLVPLAAALAIAVAGHAYALAYRRAALCEAGDGPPVPALRAYRPTRRARATAARRRRARAAAVAAAPEGPTLENPAPEGPAAGGPAVPVEWRQAAGVLDAAVLHTAFNSLVVVLVWLAIVVPAATR